MITIVNDFRSNIQNVLVAKSITDASSKPCSFPNSSEKGSTASSTQNITKSHSGYWVSKEQSHCKGFELILVG